MHRASLAVLLVSSLAFADGEVRLDVPLGKKIERDVGFARGWMCDDPSLVRADLVTRDDRNIWVVTGEKLGQTVCRVGLDPAQPHVVFEVHVVSTGGNRPRK